MPDEKIIAVNNRLEIRLPGKTENYTSRIEDISNNSITLAMPMDHGIPVFLGRGEYFYGRIIYEGQVYHFTSTLLDKKLLPLPLWIVSLPEKFEKVQQRMFVRLSVMLEVDIETFADDDVECKTPLPFGEAYSRDISGGGLLLVCKEPLVIGQKIRVKMNLDEEDTLETMAEVIRVHEASNANKTLFIGIKFIDLEEKERTKIIRYVFRKQLERKRREL